MSVLRRHPACPLTVTLTFTLVATLGMSVLRVGPRGLRLPIGAMFLMVSGVSRRFRSQPSVADMVALTRVLERDERRTRDEVWERDRRIAASLNASIDDRVALPLAWLDAVRNEDDEVSVVRAHTDTALQWAGFLVAVLGAITGVAAALAAFYYEGGGRVNVISVLGIFVGLPGILLLPFLLALVPLRWLGWLPGAAAAGAIVRGLSPGRLGFAAARFLPATLRETLTHLTAHATAHEQLFAGVRKWTVARWSQMYALGFQTAALTAVLVLVAFTDLVFGWSTTLASGDADADAARVHSIVQVVAAPWNWLTDAGTPSRELIAESRYYRVVNETVTVAEATRLGGWWPFVVLAMLVYGLSPRLLTLALAHLRRQAAVRSAFELHPAIPGIRRRLHAAQVQTTAAATNDSDTEPRIDVSTTQSNFDSDSNPVAGIVNWSDVPLTDQQFRALHGEVPVFVAGGAAPLAADREVVQRLASLPAADTEIVVVVKAWEPPLLELMDFLRALRDALGRGRTITVQPVAMGDSGSAAPAAPEQIELWRRRLGSLGDPWLRVAAFNAEARR